MDIKLPLNGLNQTTISKLANLPLSLKLGQQLAGEVLSTDLQAGKLSITLKLGNDTITLQSDQAIAVTPGQNLQLQVLKVTPMPAFKILNPLPGNPTNTTLVATLTTTQMPSPFADVQISPAPTNPATKPVVNTAFQPESSAKQVIELKVIGLSADKIQCQIVTNNIGTEPNPVGANTKPAVVVIGRSQLLQLQTIPGGTSAINNPQNQSGLPATEPIKIGQHLTLEVIATGTGLGFKIIPQTGKLLTQQITELVKQFLPKHESSPVFLNQLIKDLPHLLSLGQLPSALKDTALALLANLPGKEQLTVAATLKQALNNSGLWLEAKLTELAELDDMDLKPDFKANLLKLVHLLKPELLAQNQQNQDLQNLDVLKNLQQKAENTLAKIALEQLQSFPKEEQGKQVWNFEVPFVHNGNAEAMGIQIQWEKCHEQDKQESADWTVQLTIAPPHLGTIQCTIVYQNKLINTYFKSRQNETTSLITSHLDDLKKQLEASGLKTGHLLSQQGSANPKPAQNLLTNKLFDEQA